MGRGGGVVLRRSDASNYFFGDLFPLPGSAGSPPPSPWLLMWVVEGRLSEILPGAPPYGSEGAEMVLCFSDASDYFFNDLFPLPGAVASCQIIPTSLPKNPRVGITKTTTDNTTKSRKEKSWS